MTQKYKRDNRSGAAVLADGNAVRDFLDKKNTAETVEAMRDEINRLRSDLQSLRTLLETNEKR